MDRLTGRLKGYLINSAVTVYVLNNAEDRGELYVTNHSGVNNVISSTIWAMILLLGFSYVIKVA